MRKISNLDMTNGPFLKKIIAFAVPIILTGLVQMSYNAADTIIVGRFAGSTALAAVAATGYISSLLVNIFLGLSIGAGVVVSNAIGAKDKDTISRSVHTSMLLSLISGFIITIAGVILSKPLLRFLATPADIIDLSSRYLKIVFLGTPFSMFNNFGSSILRAKGDTKYPLFISIFSGILNVVLNLFFVIAIPLGVVGVATATVISSVISAVLVAFLLVKQNNDCKLYFKKLRLHKNELIRIIKIGFPAGFQTICFTLAGTIVQSTINTFGSMAVAGVSVSSKIDSLISLSMGAFSQAATTFISQNLGAEKYENIDKVFYRCQILNTGTALVLSTLGLIFAKKFMGIFTTDTDVIAYGVERLWYILPFMFVCGFMDMSSATLRGMGISFVPMIITLIGSCFTKVIWVYAAFPLNPTLPMVYISFPLCWLLTFIPLFILKTIEKRKLCAHKYI